MKFIYFGSSEFSKIVLEKLLLNNFIPTFVISQEDKPKGRGLKTLPTELTTFALKNNILVLKPKSPNTEELYKEILSNDIDFFIVVDYGKILPKSLLSLPKKMALGVHPSLLPLYRGPAPINWVLINGEKETGVTIFKMNEFLDRGEIILQKKVIIDDNDDFISLYNKLAIKSANTLIEAVKLISENNFTLIKQDEAKTSYAPKLKKEDGRIFWNQSAISIFNLIRGTLNWPSAYTYYKDKLIKILKAEVVDMDIKESPATIINIDKSGLYVATEDKVLKILKLKPQDKKDMDGYSFTLGYRVKIGDKFNW